MSDEYLSPEEIAKLVQERQCQEKQAVPETKPATKASVADHKAAAPGSSLCETPLTFQDSFDDQRAVAGGRHLPRLTVEKVEFDYFPGEPAPKEKLGIEPFRQIKMNISGELGRARIRVRELINMEKGTLLRLDRLADEHLVMLVNDIPFAYGEVVVINDRFGVRLSSFVTDEANKKEKMS